LETFDDAYELAGEEDKKILSGEEPKPLAGIPLAIKDNILIKGKICSAGSKILHNYRATYDATVIEKLRDAGAVFLGRTNMDEFAMGSSTENSAFGPTKNPYDLKRVAGGSSGGSAAAVARQECLAALGSDTGGSVRQPAAFCGVVGLKPTYGAVSRYGLIAMASSLDQIGPITRTVEDAKILYNAIRGYDHNDSTSLLGAKSIGSSRSKVIGVPRAFLAEGSDRDVLERFDVTLEQLRDAGYKIQDVEMPNLQYALAVYYIIMPAEASTNLARFDGVRYGLSVPGSTIGDVYAKTRGVGFGAEVRRRILVGTFVLSAGYADAYYRKARAVREIIRADFARAFDPSADGVASVALPTSPVPAWKFGEKADPVAMYAADIFTVPVNLAGVPALSVPMGTVARDGIDLPVGFQIIGAHGDEETLFTIGNDIEGV